MRPSPFTWLKVALLTLMSLALVNAHARAATPQPKPRAVELLPVQLPDLEGLPPAVRAQLREAHESVMEKVQRPGLSPAAVADAFGEMGKLFMATQFNGEAERSFRNAERLASEDFRWPYYLGH